MGSGASNDKKGGNAAAHGVYPAHVYACARKDGGLTVLESERLYARFQKLDRKSKGYLDKKDFDYAPLKGQLFLTQLLQPDQKGRITFARYQQVMAWWSAASTDDKLGEVYRIFNFDKKPGLHENTLVTVMKAVHPSFDAKKLKHIASSMIARVDDKNQGFIDKEQFVAWAKKTSMLVTLLRFEVMEDVRPLTAAEKATADAAEREEKQESASARRPSLSVDSVHSSQLGYDGLMDPEANRGIRAASAKSKGHVKKAGGAGDEETEDPLELEQQEVDV